MKRGDQGPKVQRLQLALVEHGYRLPRYGADGDFGGETVRALLELAKDARVIWPMSDDVPESMLDELGIGEFDDEPAACVVDSVFDSGGVKLYDLRGEQKNPHPKGKTDRHGHTLIRHPSAIDGICLHQMGVKFGVADDWEDHFATYDEALAHRALRIACHAAAFPGVLVIPADPLAYIKHGNALNSRTLGLEVDGLFPGLIGRKTGSGKAPTEVTPELVETARMGVKLLVHLGRGVGSTIRYIWGHRQGDAWRRADPGEELWRKVVVEYAVPVLGLVTRPADRFDHYKGPSRRGMTIPADWDPCGVGKY